MTSPGQIGDYSRQCGRGFKQIEVMKFGLMRVGFRYLHGKLSYDRFRFFLH